MTYTINEHLASSSIADDDIFMLFGLPNNKFDHLKAIGYWFKKNPKTCFRYLEGRLKNTITGLSQLKTVYPNVRFITTINDPWQQLFYVYKKYLNHTKKFITLKQFVQLVASDMSLCPSILDDYPLDNSIIILRNEYIETDFAKFSKSSDASFTLTDPVDYKKLFDEESNNLICSIYKNDISFFYPELLN
jgi:hypothetical protein